MTADGSTVQAITDTNPSSFSTFDGIYEYLTSRYGFPLLPFASPYPHDKSLSHPIAELRVHPSLEAILHILNADLPSAHFLCRHFQNKPAWEGMYIHGLLHRVEGDYENAKAWYGDVSESDCFKHVWSEGGLDAAREFLDDVKRLRTKTAPNKSYDDLKAQSHAEFEALVDWCKKRFGTKLLLDATQAWTEPSEEHRQVAAKMIVGGEGWRQF